MDEKLAHYQATVPQQADIPPPSRSSAESYASTSRSEPRNFDAIEDEENIDESARFLPESTQPHRPDPAPRKRPLTTWLAIAAFIACVALLALTGLYISGSLRSHTYQSRPAPAVVLATYSELNVSWIAEVPEDWQVHRYCNDCGRNISTDEFGLRLPTPNPHGREALVYLTYIIENYDNLPPYSIFLHGHDVAWHQPERAVSLIRALNFTALEEVGYIPVHCTYRTCYPRDKHSMMNGPHDVEGKGYFSHLFRMMPPFWEWAMRETLHEEKEDTEYNGVKTAQFAVSATRIKLRTLDEWIALRQPLVDTDTIHEFDAQLRNISITKWGLEKGQTNDTLFGKGDERSTTVNRWSIGVLYELTWHRIFGQPAVHCPMQERCQSEFFSGAISCPAYLPEEEQEEWQDDDNEDLLLDDYDRPDDTNSTEGTFMRRQAEWDKSPAPCTIDEAAMARIFDENMVFLGRGYDI